jgi:hypothetical protein
MQHLLKAALPVLPNEAVSVSEVQDKVYTNLHSKLKEIFSDF